MFPVVLFKIYTRLGSEKLNLYLVFPGSLLFLSLETLNATSFVCNYIHICISYLFLRKHYTYLYACTVEYVAFFLTQRYKVIKKELNTFQNVFFTNLIVCEHLVWDMGEYQEPCVSVVRSFYLE